MTRSTTRRRPRAKRKVRRKSRRRTTRKRRKRANNVADNKYGRIFTQGDVEKILERYDPEFAHGDIEFADLLDDMDKEGVRFKFPADEPLFILRARDRRAFGAIRHYQDHQTRNAPSNHQDAIEKAIRDFSNFRESNSNLMREPD
jgi:hypothetical protein